MSRTQREIIDLWDSLEDLAADTGATLVAVRKWNQRGIPPAHFAAVLKTKKAQDGGVTLDELASAERPERKGAAA